MDAAVERAEVQRLSLDRHPLVGLAGQEQQGRQVVEGGRVRRLRRGPGDQPVPQLGDVGRVEHQLAEMGKSVDAGEFVQGDLGHGGHGS